MTARQSAAMDKALRLVQRGTSASEAARAAGVDVRSVRRALRRHGLASPVARGRPAKTA